MNVGKLMLYYYNEKSGAEYNFFKSLQSDGFMLPQTGICISCLFPPYVVHKGLNSEKKVQYWEIFLKIVSR